MGFCEYFTCRPVFEVVKIGNVKIEVENYYEPNVCCYVASLLIVIGAFIVQNLHHHFQSFLLINILFIINHL